MKLEKLNDNFFSRLETLSLNLRSSLAGYFGGKHLVSSYGQTVEFSDFREYQLGDDIRRIDWNLFSRFEKYYLRLFTDERQMHVQIFLDCSASMGLDCPAKGEYAVMAAAALGFLAVQNMDKLTFHFMKEGGAENPFGTLVGKNSFFRAMGSFSDLEFDGDVDIEACVTGCPNVTQNNGLSVIISDLCTDYDWKKAVDFLCYKKRQVLVIQVLTPEERDPLYDGRVHLMDSEAPDISDGKNMKLRITRAMQEAYREALNDFIEDAKQFCRKRGAGFLSVSTDAPIERVLFGELLKEGVMS